MPEKIGEHIRRWNTIFDLLDVPADCRERMWWYNGAEIYGEEPVAWVKKRASKNKAPATTPIVVATSARKNGAKAARASKNGAGGKKVAPRKTSR
jgi:hypothetical protein